MTATTPTRTLTCVAFAARVLRLSLTDGQAAFVAVAVDGVRPRDLTGRQRDAALEMFGDLDEVPASVRRIIVAAAGRDSGKTQISAVIAIYLAMTCDLSRVGPGDVAVAAIVAPRTRTARIALRRALALVQGAPDLRKRIVGEPRQDGFTVRRPDGRLVTIEVFAASRGAAALRGHTFVVVIFDESAQFRDESGAVNDASQFAGVMPRVLPGGRVLFLSTPWSEEGLFYDLVSANHGNPTTAIVARASTLVMRDHDPDLARIIEAERQRDADNAAREFDALFMSVGGSLFFDGRSLTEAIDDDLVLPVRFAGEDERVGFGADIGLVRDSSALVGCGAVGGTTPRLRVLRLRECRPTKERALRLSEVIAEFAADLRDLGATSFVADAHVREPAREWAEREEITIDDRPEGPNAKFDLFVALREAFRDRRMSIPRHPRLLAQLRAVTARPMPGGMWRVESPRRIGQAHGDIVAALVLAAHAATTGGSDNLEYSLQVMRRGSTRWTSPDERFFRELRQGGRGY